jgi:hypothetical protein
MAAKNKKILLQNLNTLILDTILKIDVDREDITLPSIRKQWESPEENGR